MTGVNNRAARRAARASVRRAGIPAPVAPDDLAELARDDCALCGKPFENLAVTAIGPTTTGGRVVQVGECCMDRLAEAISGSVYLSPLAVAKPHGRA